MPIPSIPASDYAPLLPALILSVVAAILLLTEVFSAPNSKRSYQAALTVLGAVGAGWAALEALGAPPHNVFLGFAVQDAFSAGLTLVVCIALGLAALLSVGFLRQRRAERGEFYALLCFAAAGMSLLAISSELITLFINLELLSVATYALTSYLRRGSRPSEAGFKYFILGAFSTALLLYGTALLYGATGTTKLADMAGPLSRALQDSSRAGLVYCGLLLLGSGFAFKVGAVPFHMWTPDVYEGAPTPVTAMMAAGVKAAAFAALVRVFVVLGESGAHRFSTVTFSMLALLTMVGGNLMALGQRNVKRMLAYSSIAHAGYVLMGVAALFADPSGAEAGLHVLRATTSGVMNVGHDVLRQEALKGIVFYLLAYSVTTMGAFGALGALERHGDEERGFTWDLDRFNGLISRRPGWAVAMALFMLSLGGIPPTVGFLGKLFLFRAAVDAGLVGLSIVAVLTSAAGIYYYLRVVVHMFMRPAPEGVIAPERVWPTEIALWFSATAVLALGVLPNVFAPWVERAGTLLAR
jgi:NADH-quinone oxidoreductase subunit N